MEKLTKLKTIKVKDCATMGCGYYKYFYNNEDKKDKIIKDKFTQIKRAKQLAIEETKAKVLKLIEEWQKENWDIIHKDDVKELKQKVAKIK